MSYFKLSPMGDDAASAAAQPITPVVPQVAAATPTPSSTVAPSVTPTVIPTTAPAPSSPTFWDQYGTPILIGAGALILWGALRKGKKMGVAASVSVP